MQGTISPPIPSFLSMNPEIGRLKKKVGVLCRFSKRISYLWKKQSSRRKGKCRINLIINL